jgi:histidyl-tRNA synthetase
MAYADRKRFRVAVIAGENEFAQNAVQVKNLATQTGTLHPLADVVQAVRQVLGETSMETTDGTRS